MTESGQELSVFTGVAACVEAAYEHTGRPIPEAALHEWMTGFAVGLVLCRHTPEYAMAVLQAFDDGGMPYAFPKEIAVVIGLAMSAPFTDRGTLTRESLEAPVADVMP